MIVLTPTLSFAWVTQTIKSWQTRHLNAGKMKNRPIERVITQSAFLKSQCGDVFHLIIISLEPSGIQTGANPTKIF